MSKPQSSPRSKSSLRKALAAILLLGVAVPTAGFAWWNSDWQQKRKVTLNSQPVAGMTEVVKRAPVLVRLHSGVFDFTQAKPDGSDLRFVAGDDKTPLNYHIERYDPVAELGLVWVDVPGVQPGATQDIWLYSGNTAAKLAADPALTYDGEQSLVLHFADASAPTDATANHNAVTVANARPTLEGLVAGGLAMTGASQVRVAASPSLTVPAGGQMTWSAWIKPSQAAQAADVAVYTKLGAGGETSPERLTVGLKNGAAYVRLGTQEAVATAPLAGGTWAHLAVTATEKTVTLYVNGVAAGTFDAALPALPGDELIGAAAGLPSFAGDLDEVGRANTARSASDIALMAGSQGRSASFVTVAAESEAAGKEANHFSVLFGALTPDAWAVIIILAIMAGISWFIMLSKGMLFGRTAAANRRFLTAYREATRGQAAHSGLVATDIAAKAPDSSLAYLFGIAQEELRERMAENKVSGQTATSRYAIAPQSVAAIRSAMDAGHTLEEQRLGKWMVLLTIAISGGPFIGLLGTVLGVMITFAEVAAAGEVNITAIAPGIAAALLATVAGLVVAIPALFGYNYLLAQLEGISTDNHAFVDGLEKRIAETYRDAA